MLIKGTEVDSGRALARILVVEVLLRGRRELALERRYVLDVLASQINSLRTLLSRAEALPSYTA